MSLTVAQLPLDWPREESQCQIRWDTLAGRQQFLVTSMSLTVGQLSETCSCSSVSIRSVRASQSESRKDDLTDSIR